MSIFRTSKKGAQIASGRGVSSGAGRPAGPVLTDFLLIFHKSTLRVQQNALQMADLTARKRTPTRGPEIYPEMVQNALQMADLSTLTNISKIVDDDL